MIYCTFFPLFLVHDFLAMLPCLFLWLVTIYDNDGSSLNAGGDVKQITTKYKMSEIIEV